MGFLLWLSLGLRHAAALIPWFSCMETSLQGWAWLHSDLLRQGLLHSPTCPTLTVFCPQILVHSTTQWYEMKAHSYTEGKVTHSLSQEFREPPAVTCHPSQQYANTEWLASCCKAVLVSYIVGDSGHRSLLCVELRWRPEEHGSWACVLYHWALQPDRAVPIYLFSLSLSVQTACPSLLTS